MSRPATCHPEREHDAHGLCRACYAKWRRRHGRKPPAEVQCSVCRLPYVAEIPSRARFCSPTCSKYHRAQLRNETRGSARDQYFVSHDVREVEVLVRRLRADGLRRVKPKTNRYAMREGKPYYSAWKRPTRDGHHLYVVRWWSFRTEEDEVEVAA